MSERRSIAAQLVALDAGPAPTPPADGQRRAAVAILIAPDDAHVLLMQRATRVGDPWSGHISLPGGGFHPTDGDLRATAMRETLEEVGVALDPHAYLGALAPLHPYNSGPAGVEVTPFVFAARGDAPQPRLGSEAVGAFWFPLARALAGDFDAEYRFERGGQTMTFPSWRYDGHTIWGLTWRILTQLVGR